MITGTAYPIKRKQKTYTCERCGCSYSTDLVEEIHLCHSCADDLVTWLNNHVAIVSSHEFTRDDL